MTTQISSNPSITLDQVNDLFKNWRKTRKNKGPIPENLWKAAVNLSNAYPSGLIAKTLRLNYSDLKLHIDKTKADSAEEQDTPGLKMLEMRLLPVNEPSPGCKPLNHSPCSIEIQNRFGETMKMNFSSGIVPDLPLLTSTFLGGRE